MLKTPPSGQTRVGLNVGGRRMDFPGPPWKKDLASRAPVQNPSATGNLER